MRQRITRLGMIVVLVLAGLVSALPAGSTADSGPAVHWRTTRRTLDDGRTYFVRAPHCDRDAAGCATYLGRKRAVVFFLHAAGAAEDRDNAATWLEGLGGAHPDAIFVYGIAADDSKRWDAGFCCTSEPVDDLGYLKRVVNDIAGTWGVARGRVGAVGLSNGGMLALRAVCQRPQLFGTVAALAATYVGRCDKDRVRIAQWHGADDPTVPLNGGTVSILGQEREIPPVAALAQRMASGSGYQLRVIPDRGHAMTWRNFKSATRWLLDNLGR